MRQKRLISSLIALSTACAASGAFAAPALRKQVDQKGDFVMFGNTTGFECANNANVPAPVLGTVDCPNGQGNAITDTAPDVFWRADDPMVGQANASQNFNATQARSTAVLSIPNGATITYARIYWGGMLAAAMSSDDGLTIERPSTMFSQDVAADGQFTVPRNGNSWYQSTADVTDLVKANGAGAYRVSNIASVNLDGLNSNDPFIGWVIVVFYSLPGDPPRNLALFDGLDLVAQGGTTQVTINGFLVPNAGFDAKLGVVAYEGENQYTGDSLTFNGTQLSNAANPADNFFNSTRSNLGNLVSNVGDLPQLTGGPASMAGIDLDVVNVKPQLKAGDMSATISANSANGGDSYALGAFVTSISTFKPDFSTSGKTFTDLNGAPLRPGDIIEYTVTVKNTGNDDSANTVMTDKLPVGITYKPGTIKITTGPGNQAAAFTDAADADRADYTAGTRTIKVKLGTGPTANLGGSLTVNQTTTVTFQVTVDADAPSSILNQAIVTAEGAQGAPSDDYPTDGNGNGAGVPPTEVIVDKCGTNADCASPTPVCNTTPNPNVCVECLADGDCKDVKKPNCVAATHTCGCTGACTDTDGDGIPDTTETKIGTDPNDADTDDDGVMDGDEPDPSADSDMDGSINAKDPDSDNDGLFDGTELGKDCKGKGTAAGSTHCIADADPATKTDPLDADTDDGGAKDGSEDLNHNGAKDAGETDPTTGHGADDNDLKDDDGDGLTNGEEVAIGSDPKDADTDDDGVKDGDEANPSDDTDGDKLINVRDPDSDNDGLKDGTELGFGCDDAGTDKTKGLCVADGDLGATVTSPIDPDTDNGGVTDGNEDKNLNGVKDAGETDPTLGHGGDDGSLADSDGDGLSNGTEATLGTDPNDADSDDDGVKDGDEPNFADDTDGDGKVNALDPDSDGDGLFDGTELGKDCKNGQTDVAKGTCVADADPATTTNPLDPDTDRGGVKDGDEDKNHDGKVDAGEGDPNDPTDDDAGGGEGGAGGEASGVGGSVVMAGTGGDLVVAGNGGVMNVAGSAGNAAGGNAGSATAGSGSGLGSVLDEGTLEGGGCACRTTAPASSQAPWASLVTIAGLIGLVAARRRRRG